jgi:small subunit ribosomal protein S6
MIYELAIVAREGLPQDQVDALKKIVHDVCGNADGEVLVEDDWGSLNMAQATCDGVKRGQYLFFIYKADGKINTELARRFGINESILKTLTIRVAEDSDADTVLKSYKTPFSKRYNGSVTDTDDNDAGGDGKKFSRRRSCWYQALKITADWKDPATYIWLVNEFGKISPTRVSGVSRKHQRFAVAAIKRARQLGVVSYISNNTAQA